MFFFGAARKYEVKTDWRWLCGKFCQRSVREIQSGSQSEYVFVYSIFVFFSKGLGGRGSGTTRLDDALDIFSKDGNAWRLILQEQTCWLRNITRIKKTLSSTYVLFSLLYLGSPPPHPLPPVRIHCPLSYDCCAISQVLGFIAPGRTRRRYLSSVLSWLAALSSSLSRAVLSAFERKRKSNSWDLTWSTSTSINIPSEELRWKNELEGWLCLRFFSTATTSVDLRTSINW